MNDAAMPSEGAELSAATSEGGQVLVRRIRLLCAMAVSCLIFWHVGGWVVNPVDPQGPITLIVVPQGIIAMAELLGLAVITSGLGVAICGAGSAQRGPLAVAVGLAALAMRGTQLDTLVLNRVSAPGAAAKATDVFPTASLIAETWLWLALIAVGMVVGRWVGDWFESGPPPSRRVGPRASGDRLGIGTTAVTALAAWVALTYTSGDETSPYQKGQILFSLALSFLVGSLLAHWFFPGAARIWVLLAVALVATAAYLFASPSNAALEAACRGGDYVNLRPLVRPLPIEYASMGAIGSLLQEDAAAFLRALFGLHPSERAVAA